MKKSLLFALILIAHSAIAAGDLRGALRAHQRSLGSPTASGPGAVPAKAGVSSSGPVIASSGSSVQCQEPQSSLPLSELQDLVQDANPSLTVEHDPRTGILKISSPNIIGNCAAMLDAPKLTPKQINGEQVYAVELPFKKGGKCKLADGADEVDNCYSVMVKTGDDVNAVNMVFEPSLVGFKKCIEMTGVVKDGKLNADGIYPQAFSHSFENVKDSGSVVFQSHGKLAVVSKAAYGNFIATEGCDYYEKIVNADAKIYSASDADSMSLNARAQSLQSCDLSQLGELSRFIEENPALKFLQDHRESLLSDAAKEVAKKIAGGKYEDSDMEVFDSFNQYIVKPKADEIRELYARIQNMPSGAEKTQAMAQLADLKKKLLALTVAPFFTDQNIVKLVNDGHFAAAEKLYFVRATASTYAKMGQKARIKDKTITIDNVSAEEIILFAVGENHTNVEKAEGAYNRVTGASTGDADEAKARLEAAREIGNDNYRIHQETIADLRQQQNSDCALQVWRQAACRQEFEEDIAAETKAMKEDYDADKDKIAAIQDDVSVFSEQERQGRVAVAKANGEAVAREDRTPIKRVRASRSVSGQSSQGQSQNQAAQSQQQAIMAYQAQQAAAQQQAWQAQLAGLRGNTGVMGGSQYGFMPQAQCNPMLGQQCQQGAGAMFTGGLNFNLGGVGGQQTAGYNPYATMPWAAPAMAANPSFSMYGSRN